MTLIELINYSSRYTDSSLRYTPAKMFPSPICCVNGLASHNFSFSIFRLQVLPFIRVLVYLRESRDSSGIFLVN
jgi:hypothetical protein